MKHDAPMLAQMLEATRLTREGRLHEATALIQRTLQHDSAARAADAPRGSRHAAADDVIDVDSVEVKPAARGTSLIADRSNEWSNEWSNERPQAAPAQPAAAQAATEAAKARCLTVAAMQLFRRVIYRLDSPPPHDRGAATKPDARRPLNFRSRT